MNESTLWLALGWTMLHSLWCGLALGALVALGRLALWRARPALRYGFLCASLAALCALPVALFALAPSAPIGGLSALGALGPADTRGTLFGLGSVPPGSWTQALIPWLPWVWTIGSSLYLVLLACGLAGTNHLRRRAGAALVRAELSARCAALAREVGVARKVLVRVCDEVASPLVVGIVRPLIVLPASVVARCTPEQIEMVLLHELAHVRRWDNLVQLAQRVVQALLFFQPAVWLVSRWIDLEREHCCDAVVLARTRRPRVYAQTLLALADAKGAPALALSMAKRPLLARIERILRTQEPIGMQAKTTALALAATVGLMWTALVPLATADPRVQGSCPAGPCAPPATGNAELPHPQNVPAGTDCSVCHAVQQPGQPQVGWLETSGAPNDPNGSSTWSARRFVTWREQHAAQPVDATCTQCHQNPHAALTAPPQGELEHLRAREREIERLRGEIERLRREIEALRTGAAPMRAPGLPSAPGAQSAPGTPRSPGAPSAPGWSTSPQPGGSAGWRSVPPERAVPPPLPPTSPLAPLFGTPSPQVAPPAELPRVPTLDMFFTPAPPVTAPLAPSPFDRAHTWSTQIQRNSAPDMWAPQELPCPRVAPSDPMPAPAPGGLFPPVNPPAASSPASVPILTGLPVLSELFTRHPEPQPVPRKPH